MSRWWGPVFDAEQRARARRWQGYAMRSLFVLVLLSGLLLDWSAQSSTTAVVSVEDMAGVGDSVYQSLTFLEMLAVLILAPAATAGAICLDKTRGSLAHVFVTDLTNREIIVGKLLARLLPVWGLLACTLPVSALMTLIGGVDPVMLGTSFVVLAGLAFLGCSLALMLSVWASKPHEVLAGVFLVWVVWLFAWPVSAVVLEVVASGFNALPQWLIGIYPFCQWLTWVNPFCWTHPSWVFVGGTPVAEPIYFGLGCLLVGTGFTSVAIWKVREVGCRSARVGERRFGVIGRGWAVVRSQIRWGRGPSLDANPVLWREWHRTRPSRWSRVVGVSFGVLNALVCLGLSFLALIDYDYSFGELPSLTLGLMVSLGLLLLSARVASVLAEERARGSLDVVLSTPIATRAILAAKWRGAFRGVPWLAVGPTLVGVVDLAVKKPDLLQVVTIDLLPFLIVAEGAALVSLGLALATWVKRTGQATAWTITALVAAMVGWPIVGGLLPFSKWLGWENTEALGNQILDGSLMMGSPVINFVEPFVMASNTFGGNLRHQQEAILILVLAWTSIYAGLAWALFEATVRTFDRCLGRAPEAPRAARLEPDTEKRAGLIKGWGWRIPGAGGRRADRAASSAPPPQ